jgi:acetyl esterase/lipase
VAGDASGCSLVLSLLLSLKQQGLPTPAGAISFCPWVDLTATGRNGPPHQLDDFRGASAGLYLGGYATAPSPPRPALADPQLRAG